MAGDDFFLDLRGAAEDRQNCGHPSQRVDTLCAEGFQDAVGQVLVGDLKELLAKEAVQSELMPDNHVRHERPSLTGLAGRGGASFLAEQPAGLRRPGS